MLNRTRSNCLMKCTGEPDNEDDDHLTYEKVNTGRSIRQSTLRWCEGTRQQQHQSKIRPKTSLWPASRKSQMPAKVVGTLGVSHRSPQPKPSKVYIYIYNYMYIQFIAKRTSKRSQAASFVRGQETECWNSPPVSRKHGRRKLVDLGLASQGQL